MRLGMSFKIAGRAHRGGGGAARAPVASACDASPEEGGPSERVRETARPREERSHKGRIGEFRRLLSTALPTPVSW